MTGSICVPNILIVVGRYTGGARAATPQVFSYHSANSEIFSNESVNFKMLNGLFSNKRIVC